MPSGGARNRSGPQPDPMSARSDRRGLAFVSLPAGGWQGGAPDFPLAAYVVKEKITEDKTTRMVFDPEATEAFQARESALWLWAWTLPQASRWAVEPWRLQAVAQWVRTSVICETPEATAADRGSLHRFADQIGMTPAGLKENGWVIAVAEPAPESAPQQPQRSSSRQRFEVIDGGGA